MRTRLLVVGLIGIALASISAQQPAPGSATGRLSTSQRTAARMAGTPYATTARRTHSAPLLAC